MRNLTLIIPGLLGPDAHFSDDYIPALHSLEVLFARSRYSQNLTSSFHKILAEVLGLEVDADKDVPVAAVTRIIDDNTDCGGIWLRADPVHLSPDRDGLILMDSFILGLSQHDALAIAADVNKVIADEGWMVEVPYEDRWYIKLENELDIITSELPDVVGEDISSHLPKGPDSAKFNNLLNEIQMQLHVSDINQLREKNGELPVNSVWFWGMGSLEIDPDPIWNVIFSDNVFTRSLADLTATRCHSVPQHFIATQEYCNENDDVLILLPQCQAPAQYQNLQLWQKALLLLEGSWFEPVLEWLQNGKLKNLRIISDAHDFQLNRFGLKKFWRKPVAIGHYRKGV